LRDANIAPMTLEINLQLTKLSTERGLVKVDLFYKTQLGAMSRNEFIPWP